MLSMAISFANIFNYGLVLILAMRIEAPQGMIWGIVAVNIFLPILSLFVGWYLNIRRARHKEEMIKKLDRTYKLLADVNKKRRKIERLINEFTLNLLASWTWGVLLTSIIAGELIFIGTFAEAALTPVSGHTASSSVKSSAVVDCYQEEYARAQEYIGFGNWSAFTDNCCCMSRSNVTDPGDLSGHITELWTCKNTIAATSLEAAKRPIVYKERQRRELIPTSTVSAVRGFCETIFRDQYGNPIVSEPVWNDDLGKLGIPWYNPDGTLLQFHDDYW